MEFCPTCGLLLQIQLGGRMKFFCPTCPYVCGIDGKIVKKERLKKKEVAPIIRWSEAMQALPKGQVTCPRCGNKEAYYDQKQIRSADEPMTTFYTCTSENCKYNWKED